MLISENRKVWYSVACLIAVVIIFYFIDVKRVWYKLVLHTFYIVCDLLKLLMKLVELY